MQEFPKHLPVLFLNHLPVRVSTQVHRQKSSNHMHRNIQLVHILSGTLRHMINDRLYLQSSGMGSPLLPYMPHRTDLSCSEDTPVVVFCSFHDTFLTDKGIDFFPYGGILAHFEGKQIPVSYNSEGCSRIFREMVSEFNLEKKMSYDRIAELVCKFFRSICTDPVDSRKAKLLKKQLPHISRAVEYIEKNYEKNLKIDDVCDIAGMSRRNFTSRFRQITNMSFSDFLLSKRLEQATSLVMRSDMLIDDIAVISGLTDQTNLYRIFKKCFGLSPTQYKKEKFSEHTPPPTGKLSLSEKYAWIYDNE